MISLFFRFGPFVLIPMVVPMLVAHGAGLLAGALVAVLQVALGLAFAMFLGDKLQRNDPETFARAAKNMDAVFGDDDDPTPKP